MTKALMQSINAYLLITSLEEIKKKFVNDLNNIFLNS